MTRYLLAGLTLTTFIVPGITAEPSTNSSPWFTDYPAARTEARKTGKPMLVVFR